MWLLKLLIRCLYKLEMCTGMERSAIEKELFFQFLVFFKANPIFQKTNFLVAQTKWGNVAKLLLYCFKTHNCSMHSTLYIHETLKDNLLWKSKEKSALTIIIFCKIFCCFVCFQSHFSFCRFFSKKDNAIAKKEISFFFAIVEVLMMKKLEVEEKT